MVHLVFFLLVVMYGRVFSDVTFDGNLLMVDTTIQYGVQDRVDFIFNISFSTTNSTNLTIDIHGDSLEFEKLLTDVNITWHICSSEDFNKTCYNKDSSLPTLNEQMTFMSTIYVITIGDFPENTWMFVGNFTAFVSGDAGPGALIRGIIDMSFLLKNETFYDQYVSDYVYKLPMIIWPESTRNGSLELQGYLDNLVTMTFKEGTVAPKVTAIAPFDKASEEVPITLQSIRANATHGISDGDIYSVTSASARYRSTAMSYQNDIGVIKLPSVSRDDTDMHNESGLVVQVTGRLEDFTDIANVSQLDIGLGVMFGKSMVWISKIVTAISVPGIQRPVLVLGMKQVCVIAREESFDVKVSFVASHTGISTATAYNVTLFLYTMDSMTHVSYYLTKARGYNTKWNKSDTMRTYEVERITFSTPMDISIVERIDMRSVAMKQAHDFVLIAEVVYTDRWTNNVEYWTGLQYIKLDLPLRCAKKLHWTVSTNCTCVHNTSLNTCGCCYKGACQCGEINPEICLPCDEIALCRPRIPEFSKTSYLAEGGGSKIVCDAFHKYRPVRKETSCYRFFADGRPEQALSPSAGIVLGLDTMTGYLYGISNHGLAYVRSEDKGISWWTVTPTFYADVASTYHYTSSVFI